MKVRSLLASLVACIIVIAYVVLSLIVPAYVTQMIFKYSQSLAWLIIYIVTFAAIIYGVRDYKINRRMLIWYRKTFGVKLF